MIYLCVCWGGGAWSLKIDPQREHGALEDRNESHKWAEVCGRLGGGGMQ